MAIVIIVVAIVVSADQLAKFVMSRLLFSITTFPVIKNIFHLTLVHNKGIAFGLFKNQTYFFIIISLAAISVIFFLLKKAKQDFYLKIALSLIMGGALGNLIDRVRFGYVVDFLDFRIWPVFNLADSAITTGTILLTWELFIKVKVKSKKAKLQIKS